MNNYCLLIKFYNVVLLDAFFKFELGMSIIFSPRNVFQLLYLATAGPAGGHRSTGYVPNQPTIHSGESGPNRGTPTSSGTKFVIFSSKAPGDTL